MTDTVRETKRADELERGDWIRTDKAFRADFDARVLHGEQYDAEGLGDRVLLIYRPVGELEIETHRLPADTLVGLLTADEIAAAIRDERREHVVRQLEEVAQLFRRADTPLPPDWSPVVVRLELGDEELVEAFAAVSGGTVEVQGSQLVAVRRDRREFFPGVEVAAYAWRATETAPVPSGAAADEDDADGGFAFGQDDDKPLHYSADGEAMACDSTLAQQPRGHGYTTAWERVTCMACLAAKPASAE